MIVYICDKCGKNSEQKNSGSYLSIPKNWRELSFSVKYQTNHILFLCPECCETLKIPSDVERQTIADNLVEILTEIAQEAIQQ